jgi:biopolymer transport protein ExbB/TolQ
MDWYVRSFAECSPWSYLLVCGQTILLATLLERSAFFLVKAGVNVDLFLDTVGKAMRAGARERALKIAASVQDMPIGRVVCAGLAAIDRGPFVVQEEMERALAEQLPLIRRRLANLPVLAGALLLVGLGGSWRLGAKGLHLGGNGPLPLGLGMELAPALLGLASAVVGVLGWLLLSGKARKVIDGLGKAKQSLGELAGSATAKG